MTDSTTELDELRAQVERVNAKNREILAELKNSKSREAELTQQVTALAARNKRYEVDGPAESIFAEVAITGAEEPFKATFAQHFRFEAAADGQLVIRDPQGQPVRLPALPGVKGREVEREARATVEDIRALVDTPELRGKFAAITVASRASGGGAGGSTPGGAPREPRKPAAEQRTEPKLGLR